MRIGKWRVILLLLLLNGICVLTAQNKAEYKYSSEKDKLTLLVDIDRTLLARMDSVAEVTGMPFRVAELFDLDANMNTVGKWETPLDSERKWKFTIDAPLTNGLIVYFKKFYIPEGAKLYVYDERGIESAIVYTNADNKKGGAYITETYIGEKLILEYIASSSADHQPDIQIVQIGYKDKDVNPYYNSFNKTKSYPNPGNSCMVNVNCPEAESWQKQKRGIVRLATKINTRGYNCSGTLVNNTANDQTPYILSAYHCFNNGYSTVNFHDDGAVYVYFEDETPGCEDAISRPVPTKIMVGAESVVLNPINGGSDGALIKLKNEIDEDWHVFFNGWDRRDGDNLFRNGAVIHHPNYDVKKISFYANNLTSGRWVVSENTGMENAHWVTEYVRGATQGGSSGSPIFSQDGLIVGTLTGGGSDCNGNSPYGTDYYGKLAYHWDKLSATDQRMDLYLDPLGTGVQQLQGISNWGENEELKLSRDKFKMAKLTTAEDTIITGNGGYKVVSSAPAIASVSLDGRVITIKSGNKTGTATLTVSDWQNKTATLDVEVYQEQAEDFSITHTVSPDRRLKLSVYLEEDQIDQIFIYDLSGRMVYSRNNVNQAEYTLDPLSSSSSIYAVRINTKKGVAKKMKIRW